MFGKTNLKFNFLPPPPNHCLKQEASDAWARNVAWKEASSQWSAYVELASIEDARHNHGRS